MNKFQTFFLILSGFGLDLTGSSSVFVETLMGKNYMTHLVLFLLLCLVIFVPCLCQQDGFDNATTSVYVVTLKQAPTSHYHGDVTSLNDNDGFKDSGRTQFQKPRYHFSNFFFVAFFFIWGFVEMFCLFCCDLFIYIFF